MSKDNDTSSICSAMSDASISYNGEEMNFFVSFKYTLIKLMSKFARYANGI